MAVNLGFLDDLVEFASKSSIWIQLAVKALQFLAMIFPDAAKKIREMVVDFFDLFDQQTEEGTPPTLDEKKSAEDTVVATIEEEFHGSGSLIPKSWIKAVTNNMVYVIGAMRYGEEHDRNALARTKGYMSTTEDVKAIAKQIDPALKLFGE